MARGFCSTRIRRREITRAMADVLLDAELRARMERLGLQRAALFNWQKTAERTLEVYREVAEHYRPARREARWPPSANEIPKRRHSCLPRRDSSRHSGEVHPVRVSR